MTSLEHLGTLVKAHRELKEWTQEELVAALEGTVSGVNRSQVAHLEQGLRIPKPDVLESICSVLGVPPQYWRPFQRQASLQRFDFEERLAELAGRAVTLDGHDESTWTVAEQAIAHLFGQTVSTLQTFDRFNSILVYYGVESVSRSFFDHYLGAKAFGSLMVFDEHVRLYQKDAIRLYSTLAEAYRELNRAAELQEVLAPLKTRLPDRYTERDEWNKIEEIPDERLADLGYVSASRVRQESKEREALQRFLLELATAMRIKGRTALEDVAPKTRKRMDSLLRKFQSQLAHGLFSPLFTSDPDELEREAARLAPKTEPELLQMQQTQDTAMRNLARYLSADYMDVYVATSMRSDADFVSVNAFVRKLFADDRIRSSKLRYFNPTQSWIDDRVAKGLVEALMLRRADTTIYMAQKADTFGKDSEASVALGQGKPVIVFVPKLVLPGRFDSEALAKKERRDLLSLLGPSEVEDVDASVDDQTLLARILESMLEGAGDHELAELARTTWADFDLYGEADHVEDPSQDLEKTKALRAGYREWLDKTTTESSSGTVFQAIRSSVISVFVATAIRFEARARLFREIHPLALQVILSSGVLNGIIVVRSVEQCAEVLAALVENDLKLALRKDEHNYRLVDEITGSTIRVVSRHRLLRHGFETFYGRKP